MSVSKLNSALAYMLMKIPKRLEPLFEEGLIDEVICQLMTGKEAIIYMVRCDEDIRCAKVYKENNKRNFHQRSFYTEGRKVKNSRRARAMEKGSHYGLKAREEGNVAPRLSDLILTSKQAREYHRILIKQIVSMLNVGIVHGDLSQYNVLVDNHGPVIIDLPQAVNAANNQHARNIIKRDVDNLTTYFSRFAPELAQSDYASEIWSYYQRGTLPHATLTGNVKQQSHDQVKPVNVTDVLQVIDAVIRKEMAWQRHKQARSLNQLSQC
mgnify:CR=1 FL=1